MALPSPPRPKSRWLRAAACALAIESLAAPARAEHVFTGPEVTSLAAASVNVMRAQGDIVNTQLQMKEGPATYYRSNWRAMPATFLVNDGRTFKGWLNRLGVGLGTMSGRPDDVAWFTGAAIDGALVSTTASELKNTEPQMMDLVGYGGVSVAGFAASVGLRYTTGWSHLDGNGEFTAGGSAPSGTFRPGTPPQYMQNQTQDARQSGRASVIFTLHQSEGLSLGALVGRASDGLAGTVADEKTALLAARALFSPARLLERAELEKLGVPGIGFERIAAEVDYYGDRFDQVRQALLEGTSLTAGRGALYQIPVQWVDIAQTGLGLRVIPEVAPEVFVRSGEIAFRRRLGDAVEIGARGGALRRAGVTGGSAEAVLSFARLVHLSYSYNVPDARDFFPIPFASVIGVTIGFRDPSEARSFWHGDEHGRPGAPWPQ